MNRDGRRSPRGLLAATAFFLVTPAVWAIAADGVDAVTTPGIGRLTMCRDWLVTSSCSTYGRVALPEHVAVGDQLVLSYGSNPKRYIFHVARLHQQGDRCTILSEASGANEEGEKIEVTQCLGAAKAN